MLRPAKFAYAVLAAVVTLLAFERVASAQNLRVLPVPWVATDLTIPHQAYNGRATTFKAIARGGRPAALAFTEPNLAMSVTGHRPGGATLEIALDLEFSPPWRQGRGAGDPFIVGCEPSLSRISAAADEWERELAPFPPGPPLPPRPLGPPDPPGSPGLG